MLEPVPIRVLMVLGIGRQRRDVVGRPLVLQRHQEVAAGVELVAEDVGTTGAGGLTERGEHRVDGLVDLSFGQTLRSDRARPKHGLLSASGTGLTLAAFGSGPARSARAARP